jgi:hypothetical protein
MGRWEWVEGIPKVTLDLGGASERPVQHSAPRLASAGTFARKGKEKEQGRGCEREGCGRRYRPRFLGVPPFSTRMAPGTKYLPPSLIYIQYGGRTGGFGPTNTKKVQEHQWAATTSF